MKETLTRKFERGRKYFHHNRHLVKADKWFLFKEQVILPLHDILSSELERDEDGKFIALTKMLCENFGGKVVGYS